ncbi:putative upf0481 protein at3g02645 [Phtheirospermum japonicum]|uniref:Putative upf0481 protein at3g02645 n=1 Tax=Phtheirospermum japonicum TaxID=374723 RepID=A0A830CS51_9LAMI|nr:putative upf0481 protein at3g02645 [Phtheirospermum japonicum]
MLTSLSSNFDERQWIKQICQTLDEDLEEASTQIPIIVFGVPKALMICSPDSYIPHQVAIGPYHHFRPEVYDMERYKVAAAKRNQKELKNIRLQDIVDPLIKLELRIRASYHRPLNLGPEALAWMMAVDACFLFEFFQVCGVRQVNLSGNKTAHNAILRDIVMLENQIPFFVMRMLLEFQFSSIDSADQLLVDMLNGICHEISPFKIKVEGPPKIEIKESAHILDFLYHFIVPKIEVPSEVIEIDEDEGEENNPEEKKKKNNFSRPSIKTICFTKPLQVILTLPWTILSRIPIIGMVTEPIESMFASIFQNDKEKKDDKEPSPNSIHKPPLFDEITIPSVTELSRVGVRFVPTNEGITSIGFDENTLTFSIPAIELDVNSEVVLRNLVAHEACSVSGPLVLTRFTELMNGIIDTEEDAKMLCQSGVIVNRLKSEKEVAELWNGMSRSIRLTKVPCLDRVIGDVNKYYNGRWKVKVGNFMKKYVFGSWRFLTFLAAVMMLLLMCLQAFCQVYSCSRFFPIQVVEPIK